MAHFNPDPCREPPWPQHQALDLTSRPATGQQAPGIWWRDWYHAYPETHQTTAPEVSAEAVDEPLDLSMKPEVSSSQFVNPGTVIQQNNNVVGETPDISQNYPPQQHRFLYPVKVENSKRPGVLEACPRLENKAEVGLHNPGNVAVSWPQWEEQDGLALLSQVSVATTSHIPTAERGGSIQPAHSETRECTLQSTTVGPDRQKVKKEDSVPDETTKQASSAKKVKRQRKPKKCEAANCTPSASTKKTWTVSVSPDLDVNNNNKSVTIKIINENISHSNGPCCKSVKEKTEKRKTEGKRKKETVSNGCDPFEPRPKYFMSAFAHFMGHKRKELQEKGGTITRLTDWVKEAAGCWKALDPEAQQPYRNIAMDDRQRYYLEHESWKQRMLEAGQDIRRKPKIKRKNSSQEKKPKDQ